MGSDFFCGLTFPYKDTHATLILGGWGGSLIGISSLDDFDASENETGDAFIFEDNQWYDVRLRVTNSEFTVWIDGKSVLTEVEGRRVGMRPGEIEMSVPLGICTLQPLVFSVQYIEKLIKFISFNEYHPAIRKRNDKYFPKLFYFNYDFSSVAFTFSG